MPNKSRRKPKKFTGHPPSQRRELAFSTKWLNLVELRDERGKPYRRFYKLETLTNAIDKMLHEQDRFLGPAIQKELGPGKLTSVTFTLMAEDALRLIFQGRATNAQRKRASFRLVVAKNQEEATRRVALEHKHLSILKERIPADMAQPHAGGAIFLPDRYRRKEHHREVGAYITAAPNGFGPLGIHRNRQYLALEPAPHTFSKSETEALKGQMTRILVAAYDPIARDGIDSQRIDANYFQVQRPAKGMPKLKLTNCVHMKPRLTPAKLLGFLLTDTWKNHGVESPITPDDPQRFVDAVLDAAGRETGGAWLAQFVRLATADKVKAPKDGYVEAIAEILETPPRPR